MTEQELIEQLSAAEHASWARWQAYLFSKCLEVATPDNRGRELIIPMGLAQHWKRQIAIPYAELSEAEKESDRREVAHILPIIEAQQQELKQHLNSVYQERNLCVALLAQYARWFGHTVGIRRHEGEDWDDDWRNILFIDLPTGQVSWHLHDSELENFPGLPVYTKDWDGHDTPTKYQRVRDFIHLGQEGHTHEPAEH